MPPVRLTRSLVLEAQGGRRVGIEKDSGPWALFRLLDQMQVEQHSGRDVLLLKANLPETQHEQLQSVLRASQHLRGIVNEVLHSVKRLVATHSTYVKILMEVELV